MLGTVVVEYHSRKATAKFVNRQLPRLKEPMIIVVVCNGAQGDEPAELAREIGATLLKTINEQPPLLSPETKQGETKFVLEATDNLGFARGNNLGARFLIENFGCDYLLFSNNDIEFPQPEALSLMLAKLKADPKIGLIGPKVTGLKGELQSPEPFKTMADQFLWMQLSTPFMSREKKISRFQLDYPQRAGEGYHYRVMGCFFLMPTKAFKEAGGFDPATFLYAEEMIMSERLKKAGYGVYYLPSARIIHAHGATTSANIRRRQIMKIQAESNAYYYTRYCGLPRWKARLILTAYRMITLLKTLR